MEEKNENRREEIYSQRVRAGKRTYFFDVKQTRSEDYYLTITESKRKNKDGKFIFEKHKIFLYREDFEKFLTALKETTDYIIDDLMDGVVPEPRTYKKPEDDAGENASSESSSDTASEETEEKEGEAVEESKAGLDDELSWD